jgi:hypothetical protein
MAAMSGRRHGEANRPWTVVERSVTGQKLRGKTKTLRPHSLQ